MGKLTDFFDDIGDALVPKEIAPYLGVLAPMIPGVGIMGAMAISQLGSMKMNAGKLDPYSAVATALSLSTPEARAMREAGRIDPSKGTVGQKLSAGIGNFFGGEDTVIGRAFDPTRSMFQATSGVGAGSYFENPILAGMDTSGLPLPNNQSLSDYAKANFDDIAQKTYDLKYGKPLTAAEVKAEVGEDVYDKMTADELKAAQDAGRTGGEVDKNFLTKGIEMGSEAAGALMPGFGESYDPITGASKGFNLGNALQTVSVAATAGTLMQLKEEIRKQTEMAEAEENAVWAEWFSQYRRTRGFDYDSPKNRYQEDWMLEKFNKAKSLFASGGRVGYNLGGSTGGIMEAPGVPQGMQVDGRNGTFIPMGVKEKADDVPAMLSKNEFVMTADAVKAAGDGDANVGAQRMYDLMHSLEAQV